MKKNVILGVLLVIAIALGATAMVQSQEHKQMALMAQAMAMEKSQQAKLDAQRLTAITDSLTLTLKECRGQTEE